MDKNEPQVKILDLESTARYIRGKIVEMSNISGAAHLGSSLSCVDILVALYGAALKISPDSFRDTDRDRFILSKGHAAAAHFATLAKFGYFPESDLESFACSGSPLEEHPGPYCVPGIEAATGALGHGLSMGVGMAIAARIQGYDNHIYVLLSDGECNEGSVWEAAMFAAAQGLERLIAVIDFNKWQATARSCEVMALEPMREKWQAFGWHTHEIDGHDMQALVKNLSATKAAQEKPSVIIAHTVKGKGVSFMEDDNNWHYRIPNREEVLMAKKELGLL